MRGGQIQKEFFVNQSLALVDALLQKSVVASINSPPATAIDGECSRITGEADGEWAGKEDAIALRIGGAWQYAAPAKGMTIYDRSVEQWLHYNVGWRSAAAPRSAQGGAIIDTEARTTLTEIVETLQKIGIFATQPG